MRYHMRWIGRQTSHREIALRRGSVRRGRGSGTDEQNRREAWEWGVGEKFWTPPNKNQHPPKVYWMGGGGRGAGPPPPAGAGGLIGAPPKPPPTPPPPPRQPHIVLCSGFSRHLAICCFTVTPVPVLQKWEH